METKYCSLLVQQDGRRFGVIASQVRDAEGGVRVEQNAFFVTKINCTLLRSRPMNVERALIHRGHHQARILDLLQVRRVVVRNTHTSGISSLEYFKHGTPSAQATGSRIV